MSEKTERLTPQQIAALEAKVEKGAEAIKWLIEHGLIRPKATQRKVPRE